MLLNKMIGYKKINDRKKWGGSRLATPPHREGSLTSTNWNKLGLYDLFTKGRNDGSNAYATASNRGSTLH